MKNPLVGYALLALATATAFVTPASAAERGKAGCLPHQQCITLTPVQLFDVANRFANDGRVKDAESMLRSLAGNMDADVRAEARFRLGNLRHNSGDLTGAASAYRELLDEKPSATRVRLELARVLADMGLEDAARSQLRRASSADLPRDVAQVVDQFQLALRSRRRRGASLEISLAPDSNINRATSRATVNIGSTPVELSSDAQARSGLGVSLSSQLFWRPAINSNTNFLLTTNASADLYGQSQFNDVDVTVAGGPELLRGRSRFRTSAVVSRRWFGGEPYSSSFGGSFNWLRQINRTSQVQFDVTSLHTNYRLNPSLRGQSTSAVMRYERALSPRLFGKVTARVDRQGAHDPAFSTWSTGAELLVSRDLGRQTVYLRGGYYRTWSDAPFSLPPERRRDGLVDLEAGLLLRRISIWGLAPVVRLHHTENHSPVFFYDFKRTRLEIGVTREF